MDVSAVAPVNPEQKESGLEATRRMYPQVRATKSVAHGAG